MKPDNSIKTVQLTAAAVVVLGGLMIYWQSNLRAGAELRLKTLQAETPDRKKIEDDLAASDEDVKK